MRFFDLDGTILDLWPRYHNVFCNLIGADDITLKQYKEKKQELREDSKVAAFFGYELSLDYFIKKARLLEARPLLALDELWLSKDQIKRLFEDRNTMFLSKRRYPNNLRWQLARLGIDLPVVVTGNLTKVQWIEQNYPEQSSIMVGDSIMDLETGYLPYIHPVMVGYGLGTKEQFDSVGIPYKYFDSAQELFRFFVTEKWRGCWKEKGGEKWNFVI